jgi:hypothetical protein
MNFQLKVLLVLIALIQGCSSTRNIDKINTSNSEIIKVTIFYSSLRKNDAMTLQNTLNRRGYLVSVKENKPLLEKYSSYMYVTKEDHKSAVILNDIVHNHLKHNLNTNFFKEKGTSGIAKIVLTNTESGNATEKPYTPQLWSHHKKLDISPELCAMKGVNILNSLGFISVIKNTNYVYGNYNHNSATIKCVGFDDYTIVYSAVAGKDVKQVDLLRNQISSKL